MKELCIFCVLFLLINHQVCSLNNTIIIEFIKSPNSNNDDCINKTAVGEYDIREYNKMEIVNALQEFPLKELLSVRPVTPDGNPLLNEYLFCIWKQKLFVDKNGDFYYSNLEDVIGQAVGKFVGETGPGINLSKIYARMVVDDCCKGKVTGTHIGRKVALAQNCIIRYLQNLVARIV